MLSSLRNFFLALFISLLLFGAIGWFVVDYAGHMTDYIAPTTTDSNITGTTVNPGNTSDTAETTTNNTDNPTGDNTVFTFLLVGIDDGGSQDDAKTEADSIFIININSITKTIMISPLSCDMKVDAKGYTLRLGAVYGEYGINTLVSAVWSNTGLKIDYYCAVNYATVKSIFDILGDVNFNVPMDMYYKPALYDNTKEQKKPPFDPEDPENPDNQLKPEIDLKAGEQPIDGEKAIELLRYKGYTTGNEERIQVQIDFMKEFLRQKITLENLSKAQDIYNAVTNGSVVTNIDAKTLNNYTDLIFSLSTAYNILPPVQYPGEFREENGVMFFIPNFQDALKVYSVYKKPVVPAAATTAAQNNQTDTGNTAAQPSG